MEVVNGVCVWLCVVVCVGCVCVDVRMYIRSLYSDFIHSFIHHHHHSLSQAPSWASVLTGTISSISILGNICLIIRILGADNNRHGVKDNTPRNQAPFVNTSRIYPTFFAQVSHVDVNWCDVDE